MIEEQTIKFNKRLKELREEWKSASLTRKQEIEKEANVIKSALAVFDKINNAKKNS